LASSPSPASVAAREQPPDLKSRLTGAASDLLEREGLEGLTLRAAARACGVSHMAPYRHFASKDDLLAAVAEQGFQALAAALDAAVQPGDRLGAGVGVAYVEFARANPGLYRLMFGAALMPCDRFPSLIAAGRAAFERCVESARRLGYDCAMPADDDAPPAAAAAVWSLVHGLACLIIDGLIAAPEDRVARAAFIGGVLFAPFSLPRSSG
jgi:AcrR family transcriptional regulator